MRVKRRNNVVQKGDAVRNKGMALALARGLDLPADREAGRKMKPMDRWDSIHQCLVEGMQLTCATMEDYCTLSRSYFRQHEQLKKYKQEKEGLGAVKEAVERAQAEVASIVKAHSEKVAELEKELKVQREKHESNLKQALDTGTANATANLRKAVAREAEIRKEAEVKIKWIQDEARARVTLAEESTLKANKEKESLGLKLRERATLAVEATWKAIEEKESIGQILSKRGVKGLTAADIDTMLLVEWQ